MSAAKNTPKRRRFRVAFWCGLSAIALTVLIFGLALLGPKDTEHTLPMTELWICMVQPASFLVGSLGAPSSIAQLSGPVSFAVWLSLTLIVNFACGAILGSVFDIVSIVLSTLGPPDDDA